MVSIEEAGKLIARQIPRRKSQCVAITKALGFAAAEDIKSSVPIPPFSNAAMDGYALASAQSAGATAKRPVSLKVVEAIPAGHCSARTLREGECARILTGAPIPSGADAVVMQEDVQVRDGTLILNVPVPNGEHIRFLGEDLNQGETILEKGRRIRPQEIALLAAAGYADVPIFYPPRVAVLSTGDELVEPGGMVAPGMIYDSNSFALLASLASIGIAGTRLGIVPDREERIREKLRVGFNYDVLLISGGVSAGDYDLVKKVLNEEGVREIFWGVALKPGKPLFFGTHGETLVFGVPGNPVSGFVNFELLIRPALLEWMGLGGARPVVEAVLEKPISKKKDRVTAIRMVTERKNGGYVTRPSGAQGSHHLKSLSRSNSLFLMNAECERAPAGEKVRVTLMEDA